jgi:hypothetical protein
MKEMKCTAQQQINKQRAQLQCPSAHTVYGLSRCLKAILAPNENKCGEECLDHSLGLPRCTQAQVQSSVSAPAPCTGSSEYGAQATGRARKT